MSRTTHSDGVDPVRIMNSIRSRRTARPRKGIVLIVALVCMTLAGSLIVLISASLAQHATTVRRERIEMTLRQLIDSGRAWAEAQPAAELGQGGITLDAAALAPADSAATIEVAIEREPRGVATIVVTATLSREGDASVRRTGRFALRY